MLSFSLRIAVKCLIDFGLFAVIFGKLSLSYIFPLVQRCAKQETKWVKWMFIGYYIPWSVTDPGFSVGGGADPLGGHRPPTCTLFGKNVCENKTIGSCWGGTRRRHPPLDPPLVMYIRYTDHLFLYSLKTQSIHALCTVCMLHKNFIIPCAKIDPISNAYSVL